MREVFSLVTSKRASPMTRAELLEMIRNGESSSVEFKRRSG
jgi:hypothetical protein